MDDVPNVPCAGRAGRAIVPMRPGEGRGHEKITSIQRYEEPGCGEGCAWRDRWDGAAGFEDHGMRRRAPDRYRHFHAVTGGKIAAS